MADRPGWMAYDAVAEEYERSTAPLFGRIAEELVRLVAPDESAVVIDVGTGAGAAARAAAAIVQPPGFVVGVDPSLPMLRRALRRGGVVAAGATPGLPIRAGVADAVIASLVLSHLPLLGTAMDDLVRVLGPGGRLGATAWAEEAELPEDDGTAAHWVVAGVLTRYGLAVNPPEPAAPREAWLRDADRLRHSFASAELDSIRIEERNYSLTSRAGAFFAGLEWGGGARYLRSITAPETWDQVRHDAVAALEHEFPHGIHRVFRLRFIVGTKPR
jgi:ubiquinone/menaquinone biosynthesis C-methylase UbiE